MLYYMDCSVNNGYSGLSSIIASLLHCKLQVYCRYLVVCGVGGVWLYFVLFYACTIVRTLILLIPLISLPSFLLGLHGGC
jgi:hypothetical protein